MAEDVVLVIEDNDADRLRLRQAFHSMGIRVHEVREAVHALGVLGRIPFQAVVASVGPRALSLRGVCKVARRHHPDIVLAMRAPAGAAGALRDKLDEQIAVLPLGASAEDVAREVVDLIDGRLPPGSAQPPAKPQTSVPAAIDAPTLDDFDVEFGAELEAAVLPTDEETGPLPVASPAAPVSPSVAAAGGPVAAAGPAAVATEALDLDDLSFDERTVEVALELGGTAAALFEGYLSPGEGAGILIAAFAQELTGYLEVNEGRAAGKIFFLEGSAVAASPPDGDVGLKAKL
ncbi:MAG: hypothetical protein ACO3JL_13345, partial [Myxococcota bacterium]